MKIKHIRLLNPTKDNCFSKIDRNITRKKGVYLLFNSSLELIYIGKASNIRNRILQHITDNPNSRIGTSRHENGITTKIPFGEVYYYSIIETENPDLKELILIEIFKPKYN
jgi:excinuclease UvrABC nuclease subunit